MFADEVRHPLLVELVVPGLRDLGEEVLLLGHDREGYEVRKLRLRSLLRRLRNVLISQLTANRDVTRNARKYTVISLKFELV